MAVISASRRVESPINYGTYRGGPTFPIDGGSSWGGVQEDDPGWSLGWESQPDERVMSLPKHAAKLPYWSKPWYRWYRRDLTHHIYSSYVCSLVSCLLPLVQPHFGSEAELDVLYFLSLPCHVAHHP